MLTKPKLVQLKVPHQKCIIFIQLAPPCMKPLEWASWMGLHSWSRSLPPSFNLHCQPTFKVCQFYVPNNFPCTAMALLQVTIILLPDYFKRFLIVSLSSALANTFTLNTLIVLITLRINSKLFNLPYKSLHNMSWPILRLISPYSILIH